MPGPPRSRHDLGKRPALGADGLGSLAGVRRTEGTGGRTGRASSDRLRAGRAGQRSDLDYRGASTCPGRRPADATPGGARPPHPACAPSHGAVALRLRSVLTGQPRDPSRALRSGAAGHRVVCRVRRRSGGGSAGDRAAPTPWRPGPPAPLPRCRAVWRGLSAHRSRRVVPARARRRSLRWKALFDRLVEAGLCTVAGRDGVFAWPGHDSFWTDPGHWPLPGGGIGGYCVRALSHVKLVTRPETAPEAKVYLLFGHVARPRSDSRGLG